MRTYNMTDAIYREMAKSAERYGTCYWDCIELEDGCVVTFALDNGRPYEVEVYDEEDCRIEHDFSLLKFENVVNKRNS